MWVSSSFWEFELVLSLFAGIRGVAGLGKYATGLGLHSRFDCFALCVANRVPACL